MNIGRPELYTLTLFFSAGIAIIVALVAWRRRSAPGARGLAYTGCALALWSLVAGSQWAFTDGSPSVPLLALRLLGLHLSPSAALILVLDYTDAWTDRERRLSWLLLVEPVLITLAALTDPWHHLFLAGTAPSMRVLTGGPLFWFASAYAGSLMVITLLVLGRRFMQSQGVYRQQAGVVLIAMLLPTFVTTTELTGAPLLRDSSPMPFAYTVTVLLLAFALFRLGLFEIVPVAHDRLIASMSTGVVVFDQLQRVVDINPSARTLTGLTGQHLGQSPEEVFARWPQTIPRLRALIAEGTGLAELRSAPGETLIIEASVSDVHSRDGARVGSTVTLRDVTARALLAEELQRRSDELAAALQRSSLVFSALNEGVLLLDGHCRLLSSNGAAERILGAQLTGLEGSDVATLLPVLPICELAARAAVGAESLTETVRTADDRVLLVEAIPVCESSSHDTQMLLVIRDETARSASERMQRDFVANVSHELQTPLTGLSLLADTLPRILDDDPGQVPGFVRRLSSETRRLVKLTNDLMTLARIEDPGAPASSSAHEVDLAWIAERAVEHTAVFALAKQQHVTVQAPNQAVVIGDETILEAMVRGLLENALRYTPEGGAITLSITDEVDGHGAGWIALHVSDTGPGIPEPDQERIFERFYRVDKARSRSTGGHGLGLSIVRQAAQLHGGSVSVQSTPGAGSTFTVRLPASKPQR